MAADPAERRRRRLARLAFRCPACSAVPLGGSAERLVCGACGHSVPVRDGRPWFLASESFRPADPLDRLKAPFKRFPGLYDAVTHWLSPLYFDGTRRRFLRERVEGREGCVLNLGSGNTWLGEGVVHVDATPHERVDVVADIATLPFADGSVDGVLSISVLEHVADPDGVVAEIHRVLRPGGWVYTDVPFVVGYHASPGDYHRWTDEGVRELHRGFEEERLIVNGGPTSAFLWILQEWLAIVLSFGSRRLHAPVYLAVMVLTFPLKFLDVVLKHLPTARQIASCFIYVGRKPGPR